VGMGVLPLCFLEGQSAASLGLDGSETFDIDVPSTLKPRQRVRRASRPSRRCAASIRPSKSTTTATEASSRPCCVPWRAPDPHRTSFVPPRGMARSMSAPRHAPLLIAGCASRVDRSRHPRSDRAPVAAGARHIRGSLHRLRCVDERWRVGPRQP
jgi:hypothetical protein